MGDKSRIENGIMAPAERAAETTGFNSTTWKSAGKIANARFRPLPLMAGMSRACHALPFQYGMAEIVYWHGVGPEAKRQPSLDELIEEAAALLIMQQAAHKSCRNMPNDSATSTSTVANTLNYLRAHLGRIRTMFAG